jgi:uncharacterized protein
MGTSAQSIIDELKLIPHPEGGHYREVFRAPGEGDARSAVTAIYYLLQAHEHNGWHRIDTTAIWHFYDGAPVLLSVRPPEGIDVDLHLGLDFAAGHRPLVTIPPHAWQRAQTLGEWTLMGCTVSPGFEFSGFELAPDNR